MSDSFDRTIHHRENVTVNDTVGLNIATRILLRKLNAPLTGAKRYPNDRPNGLISTFNARNIELAFAGVGADNTTFDATVVGIPAPLDRMPQSDAPDAPALRRLLKLNVTLGTNTQADINPVNGQAVAATTFRWADTLVAAIEGTGYDLWDAGGDNGMAVVTFDPAACPHIFVYIDNLSSVTRVEVMARRLSRFKNPG